MSKALTVQYNNAIYAISQVRAIRTLRKRGVMVYEMINGDIKMFSGGQELVIDLLEYADNYNQAISRKELDIKLDHNKYAAQTPINDSNHQNGMLGLC